MNIAIEEVVLFEIEKTSKLAKMYSQREFDKRQVALTVDQWILIKVIEEYGPLTQRALAARVFRDPASVKRTLDLLESKELISRKPDDQDRRQHQVELRDRGISLIKELMPMISQHRKQSTAGFSATEKQELVRLLKRMQDNFLD
ncbi:MAG: MarR family transcriptional regulator [Saprospiraceae bacterium]|nr:MarR family transcriptional regulator [Saprospiraceae bacterium]